MYVVLDIPYMVRAVNTSKRRTTPLRGYNSTLLLKPGTDISILPPGCEIKRVGDLWECHTPIANKKIVKKLAKRLDAVAFL